MQSAEYIAAVRDILAGDAATRAAGFRAIRPEVQRAFYDDDCLPDQCVFYAAAQHSAEPDAFALLVVMLRIIEHLDAPQISALQAVNQDIVNYAMHADVRLQTCFWKACEVLWAHDLAVLHPASACHLWRKYLTLYTHDEGIKDALMLILRLMYVLPTAAQDASTLHALLLEMYANHAEVIGAQSKLRQQAVMTISLYFGLTDDTAAKTRAADIAPSILPEAWVSLLLRQLDAPTTQETAIIVMEELSRADTLLCMPIICANGCERLLHLLHTHTEAILCTCAVRTLRNFATRHFNAWSLLVMPGAMATYADLLQRDGVPECVKSCVRQMLADLVIFPTCVRRFMQSAGLEHVLQHDVSAGRFRSSVTTDIFTDLLVDSST